MKKYILPLILLLLVAVVSATDTEITNTKRTVNNISTINITATNGIVNSFIGNNPPTQCAAGTWVVYDNLSVAICTAPTAADIDPGTFPNGNYVFSGNLTDGNFQVDSVNGRVGIGMPPSSYLLQVAKTDNSTHFFCAL